MDAIFHLGQALPLLIPKPRPGHGEDLIPSSGVEWSSAQNVTMGEQDDAADEEGLKARLGVMAIVFLVSLFGTRHTLERRVEIPTTSTAASFPSISKRVKSLRIPKIVFFVGKHFGTGALVHSSRYCPTLTHPIHSRCHPINRFRSSSARCFLFFAPSQCESAMEY